MAKIDTSCWKEYRVDELFYTEKQGKNVQVPTGAMMAKKSLKEGLIPRVTVSNYNNGITGYYAESDDANYRIYENFISVSFLGTVFYQPERASLDMKVHCLKPLDIELNKYIASFLVTVIRKSILNFVYSDQLSSTVLPLLVIKLPSTADGKPDFAYMESYMRKIIEESEACLENLRRADKSKTVVKTEEWENFKVGDLFDVSRPVARSQTKYKEGKIPFVASGNYNNGVVKWCKPTKDEVLDQKGCITVSPLDGSAFYQPVDFLGRGGAGSAILLLRNESMTEMSGLFISSVLRATLTKFSYNDQINSQNILVQEIKLPATADGKPDFVYMESYMRKIVEESGANLESLMLPKLSNVCKRN